MQLRMTRLEANREILKMLSQQIEDQPDVRFSQLLQNLQVVSYSPTLHLTITLVDEFYLESETLLTRMKKAKNNER